MDIHPFTPEICDQVAQLHMLNLPTPFSGRAGRELLKQYYLTVCSGRGATGFAAVDGGNVVGFVCGVWDAPGLQSALLRSHWPDLVRWGFYQGLTKPSLGRELIGRFLASRNPDPVLENHGAGMEMELRPIVVSPRARGSGLGMRLIQQLVKEAIKKGFSRVCLYTEPDNVPAQRLYINAGFQEFGRKTLHDIEYLYFRFNASAGGFCL